MIMISIEQFECIYNKYTKRVGANLILLYYGCIFNFFFSYLLTEKSIKIMFVSLKYARAKQ